MSASIGVALTSQTNAAEFGRTPTPEEIKLWDIDVLPDGTGLPLGRGTTALGKSVYETNCGACHGTNGQGGIGGPLAGGQGTLASTKPIKTIGSFWPYPTTLFDYVRRAMPYTSPGSLSTDETYAVTTYILSLNGILPVSGALDQDSLPKVQMPNRDGFIPEPEISQFMAKQ